MSHVNGDDALEFLGRLSREDIGRRRVPQSLDSPRHRLVRDGVKANDHVLPDLQVRAFRLLDAGEQLHLGKVKQLRYRHARGDLVALADFGERLPEAATAPGPVLQDRDKPGQRRELARVRDPAAVPRHVQLGLLQLLPQHRQFGLALLQPVLDILLELRLAAVGFLERQLVLARVDRRQQFVAPDFQLRPAHLEACLDELDLVLALADFEFRLSLLEVLVDLLHGQEAVLEGRHALGVVEFEDQVAAMGERAGRGELGDLRHRSNVRSRQAERAHRPKLAPQVRLHDEVPALDFREGKPELFLGDLLPGIVAACGKRPDNQNDCDPNQQLCHG